jgi:hypothetical protein
MRPMAPRPQGPRPTLAPRPVPANRPYPAPRPAGQGSPSGRPFVAMPGERFARAE